MQTRFYGGVSTAIVVPPIASDLEKVHLAYVAMATSGIVTNEQRAVFDAASLRLFEEADVEAIMMGGTDLALVYNDRQSNFAIIDCAAIHVDAVIRFATTSLDVLRHPASPT